MKRIPVIKYVVYENKFGFELNPIAWCATVSEAVAYVKSIAPYCILQNDGDSERIWYKKDCGIPTYYLIQKEETKHVKKYDHRSR